MTYPGGHKIDPGHRALMYCLEGVTDPTDRMELAKTYMDFFTEEAGNGQPLGAQYFRQFSEVLKNSPASFFHEYLNTETRAYYFYEFAEQLQDHQLQFMFDTRVPLKISPNISANTEEQLGFVDDVVRREQLKDFLLLTQTRTSIICHAHKRVSSILDRQVLKSTYIASTLKAQSEKVELAAGISERFSTAASINIDIDNSLMKTALVVLQKSWPVSLSFDELCTGIARTSECEFGNEQQKATLLRDILEVYKLGVLEISSTPVQCINYVTEYPRGSDLARHRISSGEDCLISQRHDSVTLDKTSCAIFEKLDGKTSHQQLLEMLVRMASIGEIQIRQHNEPVIDPTTLRKILKPRLDKALAFFSDMALLVG
jgi:methyltransferase-like protein